MSNNRACGGSVYYVREPNGALIARVVGTVLDATTTRYYHFDALGSTRMLTDKDGVVTDTYSYDAWGNTTHTGDTEQPYQYVGQLGYYTHYQDENLDLLQLGVRFYDPETGRFTQRDPVRYGWNQYAYVDNQSSRFVGPSGLLGFAAGLGGLELKAFGIYGVPVGVTIGAERWECFDDRTGCKHTGWVVKIYAGIRWGSTLSLSCSRIDDLSGASWEAGGGVAFLEAGVGGGFGRGNRYLPDAPDSGYAFPLTYGITWPPSTGISVCWNWVVWDDEGSGFLQRLGELW